MLTLITLQKSSLLSKPGFHMLSSPISSPSPRVKLEAEKKQREIEEREKRQREIEERERRKIYAEMEEEEGTNSKEEVTRTGEGKTESEDNEDDVEKDQDEKESVLARDGAIRQHQTEENLQDITQVRAMNVLKTSASNVILYTHWIVYS